MKNKQIKSSTDCLRKQQDKMLWAVVSVSLIQYVSMLLSCHVDVCCSNDSLSSSELQPRHVCLLLSCRGAVRSVCWQRRIQGSGHILLGEGSAEGRTRRPVGPERHAAGEPLRVGGAVHLWVGTSVVPLFIHMIYLLRSLWQERNVSKSVFFFVLFLFLNQILKIDSQNKYT